MDLQCSNKVPLFMKCITVNKNLIAFFVGHDALTIAEIKTIIITHLQGNLAHL